MVNFDKVLLEIGEWGKYQKIRFAILCLPAAFLGAFQFGTMIFNIFPAMHWCKMPPKAHLPFSLRNLSSLELQGALIPQEPIFPGVMGPARCKMRNFTNWDQRIVAPPGNDTAADQNSALNPQEEDTIPCIYGWDYDPTAKWSLISEWDLVCGQDYLGHLMLTLNSIGGIIGTLIFSILQDIIGRKLCFFIAMGWAMFWGLISVLMPSVWAYTGIGICKALTGLAMFQLLWMWGFDQHQRNECPYILALEMVGPRKHTFVINVMSMVFALAMAFVALVAWLCHTWRQLNICANGPFVVLMFLWFFIDESPRWLVTKGRFEDAEKIIAKMAKINGQPISLVQLNGLLTQPDPTENAEEPYKETATFVTMWKHMNLAVLALVFAYLWSVNAMVYVGLSFNTQNFGGNPYIVFALISLIEIPAEVFNFIVDYVGRVWPAGLTMAISGLALLAASATPPTLTGAVVFLAVVSKFCITASFCILYQIGGEVFPTVLRATGIGFATMISQVLSIVTPFIVYSSTALHILPMLILGALSLSGGIVTMFLPETLNRRLPEFVKDTKKHTGFGCKAFIGNITFRTLLREKRKGVHD